MDEEAANKLAAAVGGEVWQSGGGLHVVTLRRPDGALVVFSEDLIAEYDDDAFDAATPSTTILLRMDPTEYWVVESDDGDVWMQDRGHGRGWATQEGAEHEADGIQSRVGSRCWVRHQRISDTVDE